MKKNPVIIFGEYISAYGVIRGLSKYKIPMYMVTPTGKGLALKSRYIIDSIVLLPDEENFIVRLNNWICKIVGADAVLMVAGDDSYLDVLSQRANELENNVKLTFPEWDIVKVVRQKKQTYSIAKNKGVPIPETYYITKKEELNDLLNSKILNYPIFMKAERSSELLVNYGVKGCIANSAEETIFNYDRYGGFGGELLLQDLISSENEKIMTVLMVLNKDSDPTGYIINQKVRSSGEFLSGTFVKSAWSEELLMYSLKLVKEIRYYGYAGVQFKFDPKDKKYKLLEINGRISMSNSIALKCGVNLPYLMYKEAIDGPLPPIKTFKQEYSDNIIWWLIIKDIISYFKWNRKFVKFSDFLRSLIGKGYTIEPMNWRDPLPGLFAIIQPIALQLKKLFK